MSIRVHELAKELNISSKELIEKLKGLKVPVKSHMSALDDETAESARRTIKAPKAAEPRKSAVAPPAKPKAVKGKVTAAEPRKRRIAEERKEEAQKATAEPQKRGIAEEETQKKEIEAAERVEEKVAVAPAPSARKVSVRFPITVKDLAVKLSISPSDIIKRLIKQNIFATINQPLSEEQAKAAAKDLGFELEKLPTEEEAMIARHLVEEEDATKLVLRAPVVTLMGHVDHGKTSLLDAIRKSKVVEKEAGGITQHIGAYEVALPNGHVTFLDTPGHEAFTSMRARGAKVTDLVVLVVAADDGVMPQTIEAIDHARAADVPIVVAMNKMDRPNANPDRVKKQLMELGLTCEEWGGKTITAGVSAKTREGIDHLLEMLLLEAELLELKANPNKVARGIVVEAKLSKGGGPTATVLVQNGTLRVGDCAVAGQYYGKVRAMTDDKGRRVSEAGPSKPVEVLGLTGVPLAGDQFYVVGDEKTARDIATQRAEQIRQKGLVPQQHLTLADLHQRIKAGEVKELKIVLKADVQGSLEALRDSLLKLSTAEVQLKVIHQGVGDISESDVMLAAASDAVILGFHVEVTSEADARAKVEKVDVELYKIIYEVTENVRAAMEGMLAPVIEEVFLGRAEVRQVFKITKSGIVAGCAVAKGRIPRGVMGRVIREGQKIKEAKIVSVKRFKEDVKEVSEGFECGICLAESFDFKPGDVIEAFEIVKTARKL